MSASASLPADVVRACALLAVTGALLWTAVELARRTAAASIDRVLVSVVCTVSLIAVIVGCAGAAGILSPWTLSAFAVVACLGGWLLIRHVPEPHNTTPESLTAARLPLLVIGPAALFAVAPALVRAPGSWDAMTYHLYFPYRWLDARAIHHIPTVFGDNAPAFAPQNGALLHAWSMSFLASDALTNTLSAFAIGTTMIALWSLSRSLGADTRSSAWVVGWTMLLPPLFGDWATATVDALLWSMATVSLALAARYAAVPSARLAAASGLALGFAAGTKVIGAPLAAVIAGPVAAMLAGRRAWRDLVVYCGTAALAGAPWYVRNLLLYGNPLFPLDLQLGPLGFRGVYSTDAVRAGEFHVGDPVALLEHVRRSWLEPAFLLALVGVVFLLGVWARSIASRDAERAWPRALVALVAVSWFGYYALIVPHNMETRFAVPTLLLSLCGWAVVLSRLRRSVPRVAVAIWTVVTLALIPEFVRELAAIYQALDDTSVLVVVCASALAWGLLWAGTRPAPRPRPYPIVAALSAIVLIVVSVRVSAASRVREYERSASWGPESLHFVDADIDPATIVYTGLNIPYILTGPRLRHRVVYCNIKGEVGDGLYEFWRRDPRLHPYHKPAIYRDEGASFDVWMDCVRGLSADYVVVYALHPVERRYLKSDVDGFPIEREWMRQHPDLFVPIRTGPQTEIFSIETARLALAPPARHEAEPRP